VDRMVSELELRFSSVHSGLLKGIQACSPKTSRVNPDELARHYGIDLKTDEVLVAKNFLARKTEAGCPPQDMLAVHNLLDPDMFSSLRATIALAVPVSSCSCERSFSASLLRVIDRFATLKNKRLSFDASTHEVDNKQKVTVD